MAIKEEDSVIHQKPAPAPASPPTPAEFKGTYSGSLLYTLLALFLWLGSVHFNFLILIASFLFLPFSKALALVFYLLYSLPLISFFLSSSSILTFILLNRVIGILLILMFIPIDEKNNLGRRLAR